MKYNPSAPRGSRRTAWLFAFAGIVGVAMTGCGSGGDSAAPEPISPPSSIDNAVKIQASATTAQTHPLCTSIGSYYWEIGDATGVLASGQSGSDITATTSLNIASASKWPFAAYVVEKFGDRASDTPFLHFTSGYSAFSNADCANSATVAECMNGGVNATEAAAGTFHYQGGHLQQLAVELGLGAMRNDELGAEVSSMLGPELGLSYWSPQPPGGMRITPSAYGLFLRKMLDGRLKLGALLGSDAVCTQAGSNCPTASDVVFLPEPFHYSLGHWVEDNPGAIGGSGNFAYSSAGAFGFYPWIDGERKLYGIVARESFPLASRPGYESLLCGRAIRWAWKTGQAQ